MEEVEPLPIGPPADAVAALVAKGYQIAFDWREVWQEENARAFTVAKAMSRDLLEDIREAVQKALDEGLTLRQFQDELRPRLVARGWWGRAMMTDPADGVAKVVRLGSPARLRTIYQTNLRVSYMAGRWKRLERTRRAFPYLRYVAVKDARTRPEHASWDGTILPVDHPWWDTHFPPNGWNCRCDVQPVNDRMIARRGWEVTPDSDIPRRPIRDYVNRRTGEITRLEEGLDPGWSYNVGKVALDGLTPPPRTGPGPDDGITSELNASSSRPTASLREAGLLSDSEHASLRSFFDPFGLTSTDAAMRGRVFTDVAGWPLAISAGLFRRDDGAIAPLTAAQSRELADAAATIIDPDRIGWLWIAGRDGRAMLVRRYQGARGSVDFARSFWRWMGPGSGAIARGRNVWTREEGVINQRYFSRDNLGRFATTNSLGGFAQNALRDPTNEESFDLGTADGAGLKSTTGYRRSISAQAVREIMAKHGRGGSRKDDRPVSLDDFELIPQIIASGRKIPMGVSRGGLGQRLRHEATIDGATYVYIEKIRAKKGKQRLTGANLFVAGGKRPREA